MAVGHASDMIPESSSSRCNFLCNPTEIIAPISFMVPLPPVLLLYDLVVRKLEHALEPSERLVKPHIGESPSPQVLIE